MNCKICNKEYKNFSSLSQHLKKHNVSPKEYYDKYIKEINEGICECGNSTKFKRLSSGYRKFCSYKCARNSEETKEKFKNTCLEKYGEISPIKNENVKEKRIQISLEKYGTEYVSQTEKFKNNVKEINLKKYGVKCSLLNNDVAIKRKNSMLNKYGVENPFENINILNKRKKTYIKKYNVDNPMKNDDVKQKQKQTILNKIIPKIINMLKYLNLELISDYINYKDIIKVKCKICNSCFETSYFNLYQGCGRCPICFPKYISNGEIELLEYTQSLNFFNIIQNDRNIIKPYELDIYIPSKKLAVEFDGLYYHSEKFRDKNYHLNKTELCEKNNIRLIHIFEDEWIYKQNIVKSKLKQILNLNGSLKRIHARKCEIREINAKVKNKFLNKFHIQGEDNSNIKLGAFYNGELISIMTFSKGSISKGSKSVDGIWELNRFCSNYNYKIPGIASKLLKHFQRNNEWKEIFSYADRRWSQGNVYHKIGFDLISITKPNYWYVKGLNRIHRFNLRKKSNEPKDIPEWILRYKEGYHRIYDCGHLKFVLKR